MRRFTDFSEPISQLYGWVCILSTTPGLCSRSSGESGPAQIFAGLGTVITDFADRGLHFRKEDEYASANYYSNVLDGAHGNIAAEMTASVSSKHFDCEAAHEIGAASRVGHLRFSFSPTSRASPHVVIQASRESVLLSGINTGTRDPSNLTYPIGAVKVDRARREVYGWNEERQEWVYQPVIAKD